MSAEPEPRRSPFSNLSWFQVAAGALAAMTSAWIASFLGVAGTIIGAALGSLVVTISSAFYASTLDRGRTLVTAAGTGISTATGTHPRVEATSEDTLAVLDEAAPDGTLPTGSVWERIHWKMVALTTGIVLVIALVAMGGYEIVTQKSYGADSTNSHLTPFRESSSSGSTGDEGDEGDGDSSDGATESPDPDSTATDEPTDDPSESASPTPTSSASPSRSPRPTRTATAPATRTPAAE